ncbi:MAG TPA: DUF4397 domain-containing protein [Casimicrobiaceae bacterium]|nr:DUF4397 domain-containing protein [Casimicrobiaceae bacterium]
MKTFADIRGVGRYARRAARLVFVVVLGLFVASCGSGGGGGGTTLMRVFNAVYGGTPITVTIGATAAATALPFEGLTVYKQVPNGSQELKVAAAGNASPIVDTTVSLAGNAQYSYVLYGTASTPLALLIQDGPAAGLTTGQFGVRISNAAVGNASLDVYFTASGVPLDGVTPNISNVTLGSTSAFALITSGTFQVRFTLHNSKQVIYDGGMVPFASGVSYAFVAYSKGSGTLVNAALLVMDTTGSGAVVNSSLADLKVAQAAPLTGSINTLVNGTVAFSNVPYQGVTSYGVQAAGTQTVTIEPSATPGAVIATAQPPFSPATDTSLVVTGLPGAQTALVFADNNIPGSIGNARMRVINVAPGLGAVDVLVNFATKVSNLATNAASSYFELPADTYTINFDLAGTTTVVLSMPSVDLTAGAGRTYTLYLMGTPNTLAGILTRDD